MLNPKADFPCAPEEEAPQPYLIRYIRGKRHSSPAATTPLIDFKGNGFLTNPVYTSLREAASSCYNSKNFLKRHVASRLTYVVLAVACVVTRAVDGIIGGGCCYFFTLNLRQIWISE